MSAPYPVNPLDDLADIFKDPEFKAAPPEERAQAVEWLLGQSNTYLQQQPEWQDPEKARAYHKEFSEVAGWARQQLADAETTGDAGKHYAGVVGNVIKDSATTLGATAVDATGGVWAEGEDLGVPGEGTFKALGGNMGKLIDSADTAIKQAFSGTNEALAKELQTLRADLDEAKFPVGDREAFDKWLKGRSDVIQGKQTAYFRAVEDNEDWKDSALKKQAQAARLDTNPQHVLLLSAYAATRSPQAWDALEKSMMRNPSRAALEQAAADYTVTSETAQDLNALTGDRRDNPQGKGTQTMQEAGDPFEIAGMVSGAGAGVKAVKAAKAVDKIKGFAKGIAGEVLSEQGSLIMDDPNATPADRLRVAKDSLAGALGLAGLGGAATKAVDVAQSLRQPAAATPAPAPAATPAPVSPANTGNPVTIPITEVTAPAASSADVLARGGQVDVAPAEPAGPEATLFPTGPDGVTPLEDALPAPAPAETGPEIINEDLPAQNGTPDGNILLGAEDLTLPTETDPQGTLPESPATLAAQRQRVAEGRKPAMLLPGVAAADVPADMAPQDWEPLAITDTSAGAIIHHPDLAPDDVQQAVESGQMGMLLGYGIPAKPAAATHSLVHRAKDGTVINEIAVDEVSEPAVLQAIGQQSQDGDTIAREPIQATLDRRATDLTQARETQAAATAAASAPPVSFASPGAEPIQLEEPIQPEPAATRTPSPRRARTLSYSHPEARALAAHPEVAAIIEKGGMMSRQRAIHKARATARPAGPAAMDRAEKSIRALYDNIPEAYRSQREFREILFPKTASLTPDQMAGLVQPGWKANDLAVALEDIYTTRQNSDTSMPSPAEGEVYYDAMMEQQEANYYGVPVEGLPRARRQAAKFRADAQPGKNTKQLPLDDITIGTTFRVKDELLRVEAVEIDPDTGYVSGFKVKDGPKYGMQTISPGETLFVEALRIARRAADDPDLIPFSRRATGTAPPQEQAVSLAQQAVAQLPGSVAAQVTVLHSRDLAAADFSPQDWTILQNPGTEGFYMPGKGSTVIADRVLPRPAETYAAAVQRVAVHERVGHEGLAILRESGGQEFTAAWSRLRDRIPRAEMESLLTEYPHLAGQTDRMAEEWFAQKIETLTPEQLAKEVARGTLLGKLWTALREAVRRLYSTAARGWKPSQLDAAVREMVRMSQKALGQAQASRGESGFSVRPGDAEYMAAVEAGDMATAQRMVDEAARAAGYDVGPVYHGTDGKLFTVFDPSKGSNMAYGPGFYFGESESRARLFGENVITAYLKIDNLEERQRGTGVRLGDNGYRTKLGDWVVKPDFPQNIKSADPVTRDESGNIIPLSQRFNPASDSINFSIRSRLAAVQADVMDQLKDSSVPGAYRPSGAGMKLRQLWRGNFLPKQMASLPQEAINTTKALQQGAAQLAKDLEQAQRAYAAASGQTAAQVDNLVLLAMENPALLASMADPELREATRRARNYLDDSSAAISAQIGGEMGKTITANIGQWMRRSYAAFDPAARWNLDSLRRAARRGEQIAGKDAAQILKDADDYIAAQHPHKNPEQRVAIMVELTDRAKFEGALMGGSKETIAPETTGFIRRREIAPELRALMGEQTNAVQKFLNSANFQSQFLARMETQKKLAEVGRAMGLISTEMTGRHAYALAPDANQPGYNQYAPLRGLYTTEELKKAIDGARAIGAGDVSNLLLRTVRWIGGQTKLNKVALSADSWAPNLYGNIVGLIATGDAVSLHPLQHVGRAVAIVKAGRAPRGSAVNVAARAIQDAQRALLNNLTAAGIADSGLDMEAVADSLDRSLLQAINEFDTVDRALGVAQGASLGWGLGRIFGNVGGVIGSVGGSVAGGVVGYQKITNAQKKIGDWMVSGPDRVAKIAAYLGNLESHLAAGMTQEQAHGLAVEKTANTLPNYAALPVALRELSRVGIIGTFINFQAEIYRNTYHNLRYAWQELHAPHPAMKARGARRMLGTVGLLAAAGWGAAGLFNGIFGAGEDERKVLAFRRQLARDYERNDTLAFTRLDKTGASFFSCGYLIPQAAITEIIRAGTSGQGSWVDALLLAASEGGDQFTGSAFSGPIVDAMMNRKSSTGQPVSQATGVRQMVDRIGYLHSKTMTPGTVDKLDRIVRAIQGRPNGDRSYSLEEESRRILGLRETTYEHEGRLRSRFHALQEEERNATGAAASAYKSRNPDAAAVFKESNERLRVLREETWPETMRDLRALGISPALIDAASRTTGGNKFFTPNFPPLILTPAGPRQAPTRR